MNIKNAKFEVTFTSKGGEMLSFQDLETKVNYLWQGSEQFWTGKNPTLFPIVANTYTKQYKAKGNIYALKNHGFIRISNLTCIKQDETSIAFALCSNEATRQVYPYEFRYQIHYMLCDSTLQIDYKIKNKDNETMPFGFGLHPGFNCPITSKEMFEDYKLVFEEVEELEQLIFEGQTKPYYKKVKMKELAFNYSEFKKVSTYIFKGMKSKFVSLQSKRHSIRISIEGFTYLALWTASKGAPFVCIEPWCTLPDFQKNDISFEQREGMINLKPDEEFNISYTISIEK
ncbi:MAG: aldose 1-epimerase family protein [Breznakia sp.]